MDTTDYATRFFRLSLAIKKLDKSKIKNTDEGWKYVAAFGMIE